MNNYLLKSFAFVCIAIAMQTFCPVSALASYRRNVVTEEFTGTWCVWCPSGILAIEEVSESHTEDFFPIAVHCNDVMTVKEYSDRLLERTGQVGAPYAYTMRSLKYSGKVDNLRTRVDYLTLTETYAMVEAVAELKDSVVNVSGTLISDKNLDEGAWSLEVILTENDVYHPGNKAYDQENGYSGTGRPMGGYEDMPNPIPSEDMNYMDVARASHRIAEADLPANVIAGESAAFTTCFKLPGRVNKAENCKITVLLLDAKGEVVNASRCSLEADTSGLEQISTDMSDESHDCTIWTLDGRQIYSGSINSNGPVPASPGIYIVRQANRVSKVVVK